MPETSAMEGDKELFCSFSLGEHHFAVRTRSVSEVHTPVPLTPIPGAPKAAIGYVNLRGQLFLVLDPGELLLGVPVSPDECSGLIVFRPEIGEAFAIAVERIWDILSIAPSQIHVPRGRADDVDLSNTTFRSESLVSGYATLDSVLVTLVDPAKLLSEAVLDNGPPMITGSQPK